MKAETAIQHFGSRSELAKALGTSYARVANWSYRTGRVPLQAALRLQELTRGKLKVDLSLYG
jgi:hypothetical protein